MSLPDAFISEAEDSFSDSPQIVSDSEMKPFDAANFLDCHWRTEAIFNLFPEEKHKSRRAILFKKIYGWDVRDEKEIAEYPSSIDLDAGSKGPHVPRTKLERLQRTAEELKLRRGRIVQEGDIKINYGPTSRLKSLQRKVAELQKLKKTVGEVIECQEEEQRGPSVPISILLRRYEALFESFMILAKLNSSRGFLVRYGPWMPAPIRDNANVVWFRYKELVKDSYPKLYSRSRWYQEYSWDELGQQYMYRGFWATRCYASFAELTIGHEFTKILQGGWQGDGRNTLCLLSSLPEVPPQVGFQPLDKTLKLTFLQTFFWDQDGVPKGYNRWVLSFNVEVEEEWREIGTLGLLRKGNWSRGGDD